MSISSCTAYAKLDTAQAYFNLDFLPYTNKVIAKDISIHKLSQAKYVLFNLGLSYLVEFKILFNFDLVIKRHCFECNFN